MKVKDVYEKACMFLKAPNLCKMIKSYNETHLLHYALCRESCHWACCKLLIMLYPKEILKKDFNGNLPIHIISASKEVSDESTFLCMDCFSRKNALICMEFSNGYTTCSCESCFNFESEVHKSFDINSGM